MEPDIEDNDCEVYRIKEELWDEYLDSCVFAYNTSSHESSLLSPFEVMFGRKAIIPIYRKAGSELLCEYLTLSNDVSVTHCIIL